MGGRFSHRPLARFAGWSGGGLTPRLSGLIVSLLATVPALAQDDLAGAPPKLALQVTTASLGETCRRVETTDAASLISVSLHRTFHNDFDTHPLSGDRWVSH